MNKLFGIIVTRSKHGRCSKPVWTGLTEEQREAHKQWILDSVSDSEYDGITTFENIESEVIVTKANDLFELVNGETLRIEWVRGKEVFGYIQQRNKAGKLKDKYIWHGYVNGFNLHNKQLNIKGAA